MQHALAPTQSRYEKLLDGSPQLLAHLQAAAEETLSMKGEVAIARTLLGEALSVLGRAHAQTGMMSAEGMALISELLGQTTQIIDRAAAIEAKRTDQQIDVAKLALLIASLRDDLRRSLDRAGFRGAVPFIDATFERAKWTGAIDNAAVQDALAAPHSFDVRLRPIERDADTGKPKELDITYETPQEYLSANPEDPRVKELKLLKEELEAAEAEERSQNGDGNGLGGNGHGS